MMARNIPCNSPKIRICSWKGISQAKLSRSAEYGWDMAACYTADPLASDSDDEKTICKAFKESKQLGGKKKTASSKVPRAKGVIPRSMERRVILKRSNSAYTTAWLVVGKQSQPHEGWSVCLGCFKPGHFARDCCVANVQNGTGAVAFCVVQLGVALSCV